MLARRPAEESYTAAAVSSHELSMPRTRISSTYHKSAPERGLLRRAVACGTRGPWLPGGAAAPPGRARRAPASPGVPRALFSSYPDAGGAAEGRGVRAELSGREVKRRLADSSRVERWSEGLPPRMRKPAMTPRTKARRCRASRPKKPGKPKAPPPGGAERRPSPAAKGALRRRPPQGIPRAGAPAEPAEAPYPGWNRAGILHRQGNGRGRDRWAPSRDAAGEPVRSASGDPERRSRSMRPLANGDRLLPVLEVPADVPDDTRPG